MHALIDSGEDESFIDSGLMEQLGLPTETLKRTIEANTLDSRLLARVTSRTGPVQLLLSGNHSEEITFLIIHYPHVPIF